ncbi:hypothetical protein AWM68_17510 [Fictibacillus phosphorivorans]|uniref:TNase-like domain-containing protein n=1 Tax=Fictibacillus phosphorivorans TaxID=1221500 RepID=A0A165NWM1_9BACL|nr:thermonuclease family protein [Fictibacillus phosphorivorans]KZE67970.1 hypothetical protein AWM68_17510 [Fictibacillus phosphorivorans]
MKKLIIISCTLLLLTACQLEEKAMSYKQIPKYETNIEVENTPNLTIPGTTGEQPQEPAAEVANKQERKKVFVIRVIDGDTLVYRDSSGKEYTGRLLGVNSPESTKEQQLYGKEAAAFLNNLVEGKEIEIEYDPNAELTDKYGRYLVHAFIGGRSIQYLLISEGLCRVAYVFGDYNYISMYREAESLAKEQGMNIHSIPGYINSANGFDMSVVSSSIKEKVFDLTKQIINN